MSSLAWVPHPVRDAHLQLTIRKIERTWVLDVAHFNPHAMSRRSITALSYEEAFRYALRAVRLYRRGLTLINSSIVKFGRNDEPIGR